MDNSAVMEAYECDGCGVVWRSLLFCFVPFFAHVLNDM